MKQISKDGRTWFKKNDDGSTSVGFTKEFLAGLDCCWHMVAASGRIEIKEDQPLLSVETNDGLFSVVSPCNGVVSFFDNRALNFPDKLDDETVVAMMKPQKVDEGDAFEQAVDGVQPFARVNVAQARLNLDQMRAQFNVPIDWDNQPVELRNRFNRGI